MPLGGRRRGVHLFNLLQFLLPLCAAVGVGGVLFSTVRLFLGGGGTVLVVVNAGA